MDNVVGNFSRNHVIRPFKSGLAWFFLVLMLLFSLGFFALIAGAANVSQTNSNDGFADNGTLTRTVTFTGTDFAAGSQINNVIVAVNFEKIDGTCPTHAGGAPYNREIYAYLTSPNSTQVALIEDISNNGGSGTGATYSSNAAYGGNVTVTFDDSAALAVGGTTPTTGTYRPVQLLSAFDGEDPLGTWTLTLGDSAPDQPLCFYEFTLEIDADQPPTMDDQSFNVAENSSNGTIVGTVVAADSDPSEKLTFSITGGTGVGTFDINATTGVITVTNGAVLDYETPPTSYTLDVKVTDSAILTDSATMTINVTEANDAPTDISLSNNSVTEHLPVGTAVGTLTTTDEDTGESFTYALVSGAGDSGNASFSIDGDGLETAVELDRDAQTSYSIRVRSTDSGGKSIVKQFTINIDDGNDPPTDIELSNSSVTENQPTGTAVGTFTATDQNGADTHTYALIAGGGDTDNGAFQIVGDELQTNAVFDFESKDSYTIRVQVTDNGGLSFAKAFTITITNANEPPTNISLSANSVAEGQPTGTVVGTFSTTDLDSASHTYTLVAGEGADNNADFQIVGNELQTNAIFDFETKSSYTIRVETDDGSGGTFSKAFAITITDGNDAPTGLSLDSTDVDEHQPTGTSVGTFSSTDPDLPGDSHTYTLVTGIGSTDNASFTISGSTLKTAAEFDFEADPVYDIRVRTTDSGSLYTEQTFTITVNDGNDPPTDISLDNNSVVENQAGTAVGNLTSTDNGGDTHTYSLVSGTGSTHNSAFQIVGGVLKTATGLDTEGVGTYSIRIRSTDNGG
ncbi:MAG: cadherin repeat domain-containing protein, partial [Anaerolineales bacterium]|nr:cadherin repeat domain-containing protein [Anaerolineales bacterium]